MWKCDHLKRGLEWWNLEVNHKMSWKEKICPDGFLNNLKKKLLEEKEKKFHRVSRLGAFLTHVGWLNVRERKEVLGKGMHTCLTESEYSSYFSWFLHEADLGAELRCFWDCLKGTGWHSDGQLELWSRAAIHLNLGSVPPSQVTLDWEVPGRPGTLWFSLSALGKWGW